MLQHYQPACKWEQTLLPVSQVQSTLDYQTKIDQLGCVLTMLTVVL